MAPSSPLVESRLPEFLTFTCDGLACAAQLTNIREALLSVPAIASLPDSPGWFLGVFQLRSEILGAADLRPLLLGQAVSAADAFGYGASLSLTGHEHAMVVGTGIESLALVVEGIGDVLALRAHEILRDLVDHPAFGPIAPRYRLGLLAPDGMQTRFALVALDTLLDDMLSALTDPEVAAYA
jgi:chemotaxis signal transduction protein